MYIYFCEKQNIIYYKYYIYYLVKTIVIKYVYGYY